LAHPVHVRFYDDFLTVVG